MDRCHGCNEELGEERILLATLRGEFLTCDPIYSHTDPDCLLRMAIRVKGITDWFRGIEPGALTVH